MEYFKNLLTKEQFEMLKMSEEDITNARLISEEELDKLDREFFRGQIKIANFGL